MTGLPLFSLMAALEKVVNILVYQYLEKEGFHFRHIAPGFLDQRVTHILIGVFGKNSLLLSSQEMRDLVCT